MSRVRAINFCALTNWCSIFANDLHWVIQWLQAKNLFGHTLCCWNLSSPGTHHEAPDVVVWEAHKPSLRDRPVPPGGASGGPWWRRVEARGEGTTSSASSHIHGEVHPGHEWTVPDWLLLTCVKHPSQLYIETTFFSPSTFLLWNGILCLKSVFFSFFWRIRLLRYLFQRKIPKIALRTSCAVPEGSRQ